MNSASAALALPPHPKRQEFVAQLLAGNALWLDMYGRELISRPPGNDVLCHAILVDLYQRKAMPQLVAFVRQFHPFMPAAGRAALKKFARLVGVEGYLAESLALLEAAVRYEPDKTTIHYYMAVCLRQLGRRKEAREQLEKTLAASPGHAEAEYALGLLQLMESGFREGLAGYDSRWRMPGAAVPGLRVKRWRGEPVSGKRIRVWAEQGIGDIIMFAGFIPWLAAQSPARLTLCVPHKMQALFARSFPTARIEALETQPFMDAADSAEYDAELPMGDLIRYGLPHYTPSEHPHHLKADAAAAAALRQKLLPVGATRLVGFSWRTTNLDNAAIRHVSLEQWGPIFSTPGCAFISLQHGEGALQEALKLAQAKGWPLLDPGFDPMGNTDTLATAIAATDEVISAQNANVHLAGALGVPTTLLLTAASDFRWLADRQDNLWYGSVTIERQAKPSQWQPVIARVAEGLKGRV